MTEPRERLLAYAEWMDTPNDCVYRPTVDIAADIRELCNESAWIEGPPKEDERQPQLSDIKLIHEDDGLTDGEVKQLEASPAECHAAGFIYPGEVQDG